MGRTPTNKTTEDKSVKEDVKTNQPQADNSKIMEMLQSMQEQLNQISKEKDEALLKNKELEDALILAKEEKSKPEKDLDDPTRPIKIRNVYEGEWITLKTETGEMKLTKSNPRATVRQAQLESMIRMNENHFNKGRIAIEDKDFIESHPELNEVYLTNVNENTLKNLNSLSVNDLVNTYNNSNQTFKKNIINAFIRGFIKGEDIAFRDSAKIKALSEVMDADLMEMINSAQESDSLIELYSK